MENRETRIFPMQELRIRRNSAGNAVLEGYSAVFNKPSMDMGWGSSEMREYIAPGAFTNALKNSDCRAVFNHDPNLILGRESAGTLLIKQDDKGLRSTITLPKTSYAEDLAESVGRGDIREQSFCFVVARDRWEEDQENKISTRTILEVKELIDISPVTYPAYPDTTVALRSLERFRAQNIGQQRQRYFCHLEKHLKQKGYIL